MGLRCSSEFQRGFVARLLVTGHPGCSSLQNHTRRGFLALGANRSAIESGEPPLVSLRFPSEYHQVAPSILFMGLTAPLRFLPSQRSRYRESTGPGLPHPNVPSSGFLTLLTAYSSRPVQAYFIPVALSGFLPFEAFPAGDRHRLVGDRSTRLPLAVARLPGLAPPGGWPPAHGG